MAAIREHQAKRADVIQVGEVLDKYELLERVGQGGMAVVYRGLDRTLKRVVAIKILHKHLSDYKEARDRFEREAQAVAKLRHENILEIFDYSGADDAAAAGASYIVTEFIDGQTLKQVTTDRAIAFPEIGAMVILQVCRALAHAHASGILHRDVKPENIMIRSDGVVKLMDFGISHMVDLERLTITGQLLGSPAYMAPEHVEGRPIDFRTDVFAAGIVLYQLCVGKLPFEGKNPHEVLKRIAECKFIDPRTANARIGNRLGRIILRAMAALPEDRYPAIGEMVTALEDYLDESGITPDKVDGELARFFQSPADYETELEDRLIDQLTSRGQQLLASDNRAGALDLFDRVLTIDADNQNVIAILDGINRRVRMRAIATAVAAAAVISGGAWMIHRKTAPIPEPPPPSPDVRTPEGLGRTLVEVARDDRPPPPPLVPVDDPPEDTPDEVAVGTGAPDPRPSATPPIDAAAAVTPVDTKIRVFPAKNAEYQVDRGSWMPVDGGVITLPLVHPVSLQVRNRTNCCQPEERTVTPGKDDEFILAFLPAKLIARCNDPAVEVRIDGTVARLDQKFTVTFDRSVDPNKQVSVTFLGE
ncbi:MAG: serine/threonine-protein kinase, partial [Kofleriaceae bacterium]